MVIYGFVLLGLVFMFPKGLAPVVGRFAERIASLGGRKEGLRDER